MIHCLISTLGKNGEGGGMNSVVVLKIWGENSRWLTIVPAGLRRYVLELRTGDLSNEELI